MPLLSWEFTILQCCGILPPRGWSSGMKKHIYSAYTVWAMFLIFTFVASELVEFTMSSKTLDAAANNCFMLLTMLGVCYKMGNCIVKRDDIVRIAEMLNSDVCQPRGKEERAIQMKFNKRGRINTLLYSGMVGSAVMTITVAAFFVNVPQRSLPFKGWLPFDYSSNFCYWLAYFHQLYAHALGAAVSVGHDALFHGFMIQACAQLDILKLRLRSIPKTTAETVSRVSVEMREKQAVGNCVRYHHKIMEFVDLSNGVFNVVIFIQCSVSTFVICLSTYMVSKANFRSSGFIFLVAYLVCMLLQIFQFCWHGNEVLVESIDVGTAVYKMDWDSLTQNTKKDLRLIMTRAHKPVEYTSGHVITLSLASYDTLMKLAYSIYNVLQRTSSRK